MRESNSSIHIKYSAYISTVFNNTIEEVGPKNVVQAGMDNAKNFQAINALIDLQYPHIFSNGISTYSMNLILKDWCTHESTTWFVKTIYYYG